jgi:glycosyltransferase involved in cell wall biosynthesis
MRALIVHNFYRHRGGEDRSVEIECAALAKAGVDVATHFSDSRNLDAQGIALGLGTVWSPSAGAELAKTITRVRPDIVHFHNIFPRPSPAALRVAKDAGCAVVRTLHNYRTLCANGLLARDGGPCEACVGKPTGWPAIVHACYRGRRDATLAVLTSNLVQRAQRRSGDPVDRYIALSEFAASRFVAGGYDRTKLNVAPPIVFDPGPPPINGREGILWVGRVSAEKGLHVLLDAWRGLDIPLDIVGDGPDAARLRALAPPSWRWHGEVDAASVAEKMRRAAILLFSSQVYENFALTVGEAMAHGLSIVASDRGAASEMLGDGAGRLVPPDDARAWRTTIEALARNPSEMRVLGQSARNRFETLYAPERAIAARLGIYRDLIGKAR